ncbi:MAG: hypothetical protein JW867_07165 [Candidatus Omnitrophica bacterium]|nr:hypothetical protein [Candidatus Omnitrophota bacterium]
MNKKAAVGVFFIALGELLISAVGFLFLLPAVLYLAGYNLSYHSLGDAFIRRINSAGFEKLYLFWPVICIMALPIAIGLFLKKEWARKSTLLFLPAFMLINFPLVFDNITIVSQKINIMFGFSLALKDQSSFWVLLIKILSPWLVYFCLLTVLTLILKKYLTSPEIKQYFGRIKEA